MGPGTFCPETGTGYPLNAHLFIFMTIINCTGPVQPIFRRRRLREYCESGIEHYQASRLTPSPIVVFQEKVRQAPKRIQKSD